jgi:hypothetical protein
LFVFQRELFTAERAILDTFHYDLAIEFPVQCMGFFAKEIKSGFSLLGRNFSTQAQVSWIRYVLTR